MTLSWEALLARCGEGTAEILAAAGAEPPVTEAVVRGWLMRMLRPPWDERRPPVPLITRLREDRWLDLLLPSIFEFDGLGADIAAADYGETTSLPGAVAMLVAEGRLKRETVLAATVDRLLRGDKPNALRPFMLLHDALEPTLDELAGHSPAYARLLAEANGAVAAVAQRSLRAVDDAGRLDVDTLLEVSGPALARTEKTLVRTQLSWLAKVARRAPERAGEVYETVAVAFGHPALDVQERALTMVATALGKLDAPVRARLAGASAALAGDLPARAAELFGLPQALSPALATLPEPVPAAPMPPPVADPAELAEEVVVLVHEQSGVRWERVLAGLVTLVAAGEREALAAALTPVLDQHAGTFTEHDWNRGSALVCLGAAIRMATRPVRHDATQQRLHSAVRTAHQEGRRGGLNSKLSALPHGVLALRAAEIAVTVTGAMPPALVATPSQVNGSLDAAVLARRLARAEAEGWEPLPFDLEQALLRVPRGSRTGWRPAACPTRSAPGSSRSASGTATAGTRTRGTPRSAGG